MAAPLRWRQPGDTLGKDPTRRPRTLLSVHVATSYWHTTELLLTTLATNTDAFDVVLLDDGSHNVNIRAKAQEMGIHVISTQANAAKGHTSTLNQAWAYFVEHGEYDHLVVCNNDVLVATGAVQKLTDALRAGWSWVMPMVSQRGTTHPGYRLQDYYQVNHSACEDGHAAGGCASDWTDQPLNYKAVQAMLDQAAPGIGGQVVVPVPRRDPQKRGVGWGVNGCVMAFAKAGMLPYAHSAAPHQLFDPTNVNDHTRNEEALLARMQAGAGRGVAVGVHTGAFVYHAKGYTLDSTDVDKLDESAYPSKL